MKGSLLIVSRSISLLILLALAALLVPVALIPYWYSVAKNLEQLFNSNSQIFLSDLQTEIDPAAKLLHPFNSSSRNLAKFLVSSLNENSFSSHRIETRVASVLLQALLTVPYLTQISYIGLDGLFFSYLKDGDQVFAMYSNSSLPFNWRKHKHSCYIQPINRNTGRLQEEAMTLHFPLNMSLFQLALNSSDGYGSLGTKWNNVNDILFLSSASIIKKGVISLGFPVAALTEFVTRINRQGGDLYLFTKDGKVIVKGLRGIHMVPSGDMVSVQIGDQMGYIWNISCKNEAGTLEASLYDVRDTKYKIYCSQLDIMGVDSVYIVAFRQSQLLKVVHKNGSMGVLVLAAVMIAAIIFIFSFLLITVRAARREMHLCASLITQMDATQQAERKSMNKSLAFARSSHDIRTSLAGLTGLIEISCKEVAPGSDLETNLKQMDACSKYLFGLLNSILDTSKIEAGKMQLEEEEFDLSDLLEDAVDLYHPVAMKKGVDVVLDPGDGSLIRFSHVRGDKYRIKQVLCNLLSNAVKFTDEGHIMVRAWVQKLCFKNTITTYNRSSFMKPLSCLAYKKKGAHGDLEALRSVQDDPNIMDFVFEVDDTGKGIPKEKQKLVFENYVQVKETALRQGGTGLGLGIVQSLVRLMHGDIRIVDKDIGERGTCFRFNVSLAVCKSLSDDTTREDIELGRSDRREPSRLTNHTPSSGSSRCSPSPMSALHLPSPKPEASRVVLLIQNVERRKISRKFMESLGIKLSVVKQWEHLSSTLNLIKQSQSPSSHNSSRKSDLNSKNSDSISHKSNVSRKDVPLSAMDGIEYIPSVFKRTNRGSTPGFILVIIDANAGPFEVLCRIVAEFRRGLNYTCRVVWLEKPLIQNFNLRDLDHQLFDLNDIVISKPFHGTRLYEAIRLLPEFGHTSRSYSSVKRQIESENHVGRSIRGLSSSKSPIHGSPFANLEELQDNEGSWSAKSWTELLSSPLEDQSYAKSKERNLHFQKYPVHHREILDCGSSNIQESLSGKRFLVVEDNKVLSMLALAKLSSLGASAELCMNGEEAVQQVCNGLIDQMKDGAFIQLPYDYILMDCEMLVMDGCEATRQIRKTEKNFGVRIPIIAFTAHDGCSAEAKMMVEAGVNVHLRKPLKEEHLLEAIRYIHGK